jgi:hypothetical protein
VSKKTKKQAKKRPSTALVRRQAAPMAKVDPSTPTGMLLSLAMNPKLSVDKLERIISAQERLMDRQAKMEFEAAFDEMAEHIPIITKRGIIKNKEGKVQSRYARFEDIQRIIKPIIKRFGFSLSYKTEWPDGLIAEVVAVLTHKGGHSRESRFRSPADASGGKNAIQGLGSANSYGKRYAVRDVLNIVEQGQDDDGNKAGDLKETRQQQRQQEKPPPPSAGTNAADNEPITEGQLKRFWATMKNSGRDEAQTKMWLARRYGIQSSKAIKRKDIDEICTFLEAHGDLPELEREPGAEG